MAYNGVQIENSPNIIVITDSDANQITVTQPITRTVEVAALGPQGPVGPQGPSGSFDSISGSFVTTASFAAFTASYQVDSASFDTRILSNSSSIASLSSSYLASSASFNTRILNNSASISSLSASFLTFSGSYNTGSFTGSFTGSANLLNFTASSAFVTGNVTVLGTASINTLIVNQTQLSTGSNQLGDAADDTQTLYGTVVIPTGSLTVSGSSYFTGSLSLGTGTVLYGDTVNSSLILDQTTGAYLKYGTTSEIGLLGSITRLRAANSIQLQTGTTTHLFVSSSGNVGINTTSSVSKLTVAGGTDTIYNDGTLKVVGDIALNSANNLNPGLNRWALRVRASGSEGAFDIYDARNSVSRLFINDAGSVGIGTTAPTGSLHVRGGLGGATSLATATGNAILRLDYASNPGLGIYFGAINSGGGAFQYIQAGTSTGTIAYNLTLSPYGGNVGVGITAPTGGRLQIQGTGTTSTTTALLVQNANASASLVVLDNGNVYSTGPGFNTTNTVFGLNAFLSNTSGTNNTAYGYLSMYSNTTGTSNTAKGYRSLYSNSVGLYNTAIGDNALQGNTSGSNNTGVGLNALFTNATGSGNTAVGRDALLNNGTSNNTALGFQAASSNITGSGLTAIGYQALKASLGSNNTAVGYTALLANTTGVNNTAVGYTSLYYNVTGINNVAIGHSSLFNNLASGNTALGYEAARANTSGTGIVAIGYQTLRLSTGNYNTGVGYSALWSNTTGIGNTALGESSLAYVTTASGNTAVGRTSLALNTAANNTAVGYEAAYSNTTGTEIVAIGYQALRANTAQGNTAVGYQALQLNSVGGFNTAVGRYALWNSTSGSNNVGVGTNALINNTTGQFNIGIGTGALNNNAASSNNIAIGIQALYSNTVSSNIAIGYEAAYSNSNGTGITAIGHQALKFNSGSNSTALGHQALYNTTTGASNTAIGNSTLVANTTGTQNIAVGSSALGSTVSDVGNVAVGHTALTNLGVGSLNTAVGNIAGRYISGGVTAFTTGSNSIFIGNAAYPLGNNQTNQVVIGYNAVGLGSNTTVLGNTSITQTHLFGSTTVGSSTFSPLARLHVLGAGSTSATNTLQLQNASSTTLLTIRDDGNASFNGNTQITGSLAISASAGTGSAFTVYKSGSTVMSIQGSQGELFSITDSLSGSLFSVSNISGLPILEVFSDNTVLLGSYLDPMLITTQRVTANSGSTVIYSLPTSSYDGVFVDYVIRSGSNARAGQFMGMWSGSTSTYTDNSATDFGPTSGFIFGLITSGSNMVLTGSASTSGWTVRAGIRSI